MYRHDKGMDSGLVLRFSAELIGCTAFASDLKDTTTVFDYQILIVSAMKIYSNGNAFHQTPMSMCLMGLLSAVAKHQCPIFMARVIFSRLLKGLRLLSFL